MERGAHGPVRGGGLQGAGDHPPRLDGPGRDGRRPRRLRLGRDGRPRLPPGRGRLLLRRALTSQTGGSYDGLFQIFLIRILGAGPYSHFLYTGLIGMGIAYYHDPPRRPMGAARPGSGSALAAAGVGAHFFWNSPLLGELLGDGGLRRLGAVRDRQGPADAHRASCADPARPAAGAEVVRALQPVAQVDDGTITADELRGARRAAVPLAARDARPAAAKGAAGGQAQGPDPAPADQPRDGREPGRRRGSPGRGAAARPGAGAEGGVRGAAVGRPRWRPPAAGQPRRSGPVPVAAPTVAQPACGRAAAPVAAAPAAPPPPPPRPHPPGLPPTASPTRGWPRGPRRTRAAPMVTLGGRLELVVAERAGDWARVAAVNGWTAGWTPGDWCRRRSRARSPRAGPGYDPRMDAAPPDRDHPPLGHRRRRGRRRARSALRRVTYADYTASGRSLTFIEDYLRDAVLPLYANTHTESSGTGLQTTRFREEARRDHPRRRRAPTDEHVGHLRAARARRPPSTSSSTSSTCASRPTSTSATACAARIPADGAAGRLHRPLRAPLATSCPGASRSPTW